MPLKTFNGAMICFFASQADLYRDQSRSTSLALVQMHAGKVRRVERARGDRSRPYTARNKWVMLERPDALGDRELKSLIENSYQMIFAKLTKKAQTELGAVKKPTRRQGKK